MIGARPRLQGHEIGNHSVSHDHASDLNKEGEELQVEDAKKFLDSNFNADFLRSPIPSLKFHPGFSTG